MTGRPSTKNEDTIDKIVERLACGEPMAQICADPSMPSFPTVLRWEDADPSFRERSARAREHGTHFMADDCIRISDDPSLDPGDKRIRIDTRLRLIGKWNAKRYGDKTLLGSDPENPLPMAVSLDMSKLSEAALREIEAAGKAKE